MALLEQLDLAPVVFAPVPVAVEDSGDPTGSILRNQKYTRDTGPSSIVEFEPLLDPLAAVLGVDHTDR